MYSCKDIDEWFKWKNTPDKIKDPISVEDQFKDYTEICGGENQTDVLYNILYLYAIGLYIKTRNDPNINYSVSIRIQKGTQYLHSLNYINKNRDDDVDKCLNPLAKVYFSYGNLTVMWPGGNTLKGNGNNGYYDNPDIFFRRHKEWFFVLEKKRYAFLDVFVERIKNKNYETLETFVDSFKDLREFADYINGIVEIVNDRTEKIKEELKNSVYNNNN